METSAGEACNLAAQLLMTSMRQMTDSKIKSAKGLHASGVQPRGVAGNLGVSVPTLYRWIPASSRPLRTIWSASEGPLHRPEVKGPTRKGIAVRRSFGVETSLAQRANSFLIQESDPEGTGGRSG
jgi:hypothetical protein